MSLKYLRISALNSILPETFLIILFPNETVRNQIYNSNGKGEVWLDYSMFYSANFFYIYFKCR